jgi:hypothetical protein
MGEVTVTRAARDCHWTVIRDGLPIGTIRSTIRRNADNTLKTAWCVVDAGPAVEVSDEIQRSGWDSPTGPVDTILDLHAAHERLQAAPPEGMTEREREILEHERIFAFWSYHRRIAEAQRRFGLSEWRYLQLLNAMLDSTDPVYRAYAPDVITRLERLRSYQLRRGGGSHRRHPHAQRQPA